MIIICHKSFTLLHDIGCLEAHVIVYIIGHTDQNVNSLLVIIIKNNEDVNYHCVKCIRIGETKTSLALADKRGFLMAETVGFEPTVP